MAVAFLLVTGLAVPLLAWQTHRAFVSGMPVPPLRELVPQTVILQGILALLAWLTARSTGLAIPLDPVMTLPAVGAGLLWLALGAATIPLRERLRPAWEQARTDALAPRTVPDWFRYATLALVASVAEEYVYRGVAFELLRGMTGGWWLPALASAVTFGLAHLAQGWRAALMVTAFGLGFQGVAHAGGSLVPAMVVHFAWDLGFAAWLACRPRPPAAILVLFPFQDRRRRT